MWRDGWDEPTGTDGTEVSVFTQPCEFCGAAVRDHTPSELKSCVIDLEQAEQQREALDWWRSQQ
jgi:hypothetical protein